MKHFPIYIYIGDDEKKIKSLIKELEDTFPPDREREVYFAEDTPLSDVLSSVNTLSLFGSGKVVKVYGFEKWLVEFHSYFKNPLDSVTLILISYTEPKEIEGKVKQYITKNVSLKTISAAKQSQEDVLSALSGLNIKLTPEAKRFIAENANKSGDAGDIAELLSAIPVREGGLTVDDIYPYIEGKENVFLFLDSLFAKNFKQSLSEFDKLCSAGESMIGVLVQIHNRLRNVWNIKSASGLSEGDIAKKFAIHPFVVKKCFSDAGKFNFPKIISLITEIQKLDVYLKSYDKNVQKICFEKLIYLFCV